MGDFFQWVFKWKKIRDYFLGGRYLLIFQCLDLDIEGIAIRTTHCLMIKTQKSFRVKLGEKYTSGKDCRNIIG